MGAGGRTPGAGPGPVGGAAVIWAPSAGPEGAGECCARPIVAARKRPTDRNGIERLEFFMASLPTLILGRGVPENRKREPSDPLIARNYRQSVRSCLGTRDSSRNRCGPSSHPPVPV